MIIQCASCSRKYIVKDSDIPQEGRTVQCGYCSVSWFQKPKIVLTRTIRKTKKQQPTEQFYDDPALDIMKASDGKTYKFLGKQWAQLMPSGKTGLFAKKIISQELNRISGRKGKSASSKRQKSIGEFDPSSIGLSNQENLPSIHEKKGGLGFFGYISLIIILGFSFVGILKVFESNILFHFPEVEPIFELLNIQLEYLSESIRNIITIINDLINSY